MMHHTSQADEYERMISSPVSSLVIKLAIPTVTSMLVSSIYNMAETFFVSRLGPSASAAVGIVFSIMSIIQAVGFTLGMGSGSLVARALGAKQNDTANKYASSAFFAACVFGTTLSIVGLTHIDFLMNALGSTKTVFPYAKAYARYILIGAPIMTTSFVMNNVLRSEGHASFSMVALTSGGVLNMLLDPVFIFHFKLGTAGAAIATLISQCVSFCILFQFFVRKIGVTRLKLSSISKEFSDYAKIISTGLPSMFRQGLATVSTVLLNHSASVYGDAALSAISIVMRIVIFVASIMIGIGQGFTPVSGYNYGAKKYSRVKKAYFFTVKIGFVFLSFVALVLSIFAPHIIGIFRDDVDVVKIGASTLRFQAATLPLHALIVSTNMLMQSTGKSLQATFLACNRQGVYFIPLIFILPRALGLLGIEMTQALADGLSALTAIPYVVYFMKTLPENVE